MQSMLYEKKFFVNFQHEEKNDFCRTQNVLFLVSHTIWRVSLFLTFTKVDSRSLPVCWKGCSFFGEIFSHRTSQFRSEEKTQMNCYLLYCTCSLIHMRNGQLRIEFLKIQHIPLLGPKCFYIGYKLIHLYLDQTQPGLRQRPASIWR